MSTASTKRARKKARAQARQQAEQPRRQPSVPEWREHPEISGRRWTYACFAILLVAAVLRLYALDLKPMHHDEGVNGFFLSNLVRQGIYKYDPANYHGPTLYYLSLPFVSVFGLNTFSVRLVTALFGTGLIALMFCLRRQVGILGALAAASLVAVSPGAVYYSRYYIHETLFVFFTVAVVVCLVRFHTDRSQEPPRAQMAFAAAGGAIVLVVLSLFVALSPESFASRLSGLDITLRTVFVTLIGLLFGGVFVAFTIYDGSRGVYLMLATLSAALMFATKETAFISAGVLGLAAGLAWGFVRLTGQKERDTEGSAKDSPRAARDPILIATVAIAAFGLFLFVNVLFYSSFFTNGAGVADALKTFKVWTQTGTSEFHKKEFGSYVAWLLQEESVSVILATIGSAAALMARRKNVFAIFAGAWAFGTALAYSLIPYKTPWLMLNFTVPMALIGGFGIQLIYDWSRRLREGRALAVVLVGFASAFCVYQTVVLNLREYDNDQYPYVYAHTRRETNQLVHEVEAMAGRAGTGVKTGIAIATPDYWPLPWYLRDYTGVAYDQKVLGSYDPGRTPIIIGKDDKDLPRLRQAVGGGYTQVDGTYPLRPGVDLVLFGREDLVRR